jgi:anti-anti-sigma factor
LAARLTRVIESTWPQELVMDLSDTTILDLRSVRVIADALRQLGADRQLVIRNPRPIVHKVLEITGMDRQCRIEHSNPSEVAGAEASTSTS